VSLTTLLPMLYLQEYFALIGTWSQSGRSGNPKNLGRVIWVLESSGNEICYPKSPLKIYYPIVRVRVRVYPMYPKIYKVYSNITEFCIRIDRLNNNN
jgi:hypothetical protein